MDMRLQGSSQRGPRGLAGRHAPRPPMRAIPVASRSRNPAVAPACGPPPRQESGQAPGRTYGRQARRFPSNRPRDAEGVPARRVAVEQLLRIEQDGAFVGALDRHGGFAPRAGARLSAAGRRDATRLTAGVTRLRRRLDWRLQQLCSRPLAGMDPVLLQILRLGLFELFEADLPPWAVSTHVDLARAMAGDWSVKFVNGVLRSAVRARDAGQLSLPPPPPPGASAGQKADALGIRHSHPTWLVQRWLPAFGEAATEQLLAANNRVPCHGVRANSLRGSDAESLLQRLASSSSSSSSGGSSECVATRSSLLPGEFVRLEAGLQTLLDSGLVESGACTVQDEAAGLVVALLDPRPGQAVLDACAAPGGKALFAAARMRNQGWLLALDPGERKLRALAKAAERCGVSARLLTPLHGTVQALAGGQLRVQPPAHLAATQLAPGAAASAAPAPAASGSPWGGVSLVAGYQDELDEFFGTELSAAGLPPAWEAPPAAAPATEQPDGGASTPPAASGDAPLQFDRVLLDAPCTGSGVLAKRADLRWRRGPAELAQLCALQAEMLAAAAKLVRPGGLLVYSTCSIEAEENQGQVAAFLAGYPGFAAEPAPPGLLPPAVVTREGFLATLPHVHGTDGAFAARLRRRR